MNSAVKQDIQAALKYIDANCDRDTWIKIGTAIKDAFPGHEGSTLFHAFSSQSSSYKRGECDAQWNSFQPGSGSGSVSLSTLFYYAKQGGYRPEYKRDNHTFTPPEPLAPQSVEQQENKEKSKRERRKQWRDRIWSTTSDEAKAKYLPLYLQSRGLAPDLDLPNTSATDFYTATGKPAIISAMHDDLGEFASVHVIPLNFDGTRDTSREKITAGFPSGACIWLSTPEEIKKATVLWQAEGLETACTILQDRDQDGKEEIAIAAVGSAYNLSRQQIPEQIKDLRLLVDKDRSFTGEKQALRCLNQYDQKITLYIPPLDLAPEQKSVDWLDWLNQGCPASEEIEQIELCYNVFVNARPRDIERVKSLRECPELGQNTSQKYPEPFEIKPNTRLLALDWSLGTGKTTFLEQLFEKATRAVAFTPRIALTNQMAERFGALNYQDFPDHKIKTNKLACTINSAQRIDILEGNKVNYLDVLAIDEPEQGLPVVFGNEMLAKNESGDLYEHLRFLMRSSRLVVLTDAFITNETIESVQKMMGIEDDQVEVIKHKYTDPDSQYISLPNKELFLEKAYGLVAQNKRVAIACTSRSDAKALHKELNRQFPDKKVLALHADSDKESLQTLADPNREWVKYDVVLWSPTVSSGVNFDVVGHFDYVMLLAPNVPGMPWTDLMQMPARVRYPKSKTFYMYVEGKTCRRATRPETIREQALSAIIKTKHLLRFKTAEDGTVTRHPLNDEHFEAWVALESVNRGRTTDVKRSLLTYLKRQGHRVYEVQEPKPKEQKQEKNAALETSKKELREQKYSAIANAPELSISEAETINQSPQATPEQKESAKKALILHDFGFVNPDLVKRCESHEKLRRKIRNLSHGLLWNEGERRHFELKDQRDLETGFDKHLKHHTATAQFLGELLQSIDRHVYPNLLQELNFCAGMEVPNLDKNTGIETPQKVERNRPDAAPPSSCSASVFYSQVYENKRLNQPPYEVEKELKSLFTQSRVEVESEPPYLNKCLEEEVWVNQKELEANEEFKEELEQLLGNEKGEAARRVGLPIHPDKLNKQVGCILDLFGIKRESKRTTGGVRLYKLKMESLTEIRGLCEIYDRRVRDQIHWQRVSDSLLDDLEVVPEVVQVEGCGVEREIELRPHQDSCSEGHKTPPIHPD